MGRFFNPDAKNPLYRGAMTLREAREGTSFVTYDTKNDEMRFITLSSYWTATTQTTYPRLELSTRLIANGVEIPRDHFVPRHAQEIILLDDRGVHPYEDGSWHPHIFSVLATPENIRALDAWLKARGRMGVGRHIWALVGCDSVPITHKRRFMSLFRPYILEAAS